jgi:hypothetical protein
MDATEIIIQTQEIRRRLRTAFNALDGIQYPADERSDDIKTRVMIAKKQIEGAINVIERSTETDRRINKRYTYHPNPFFNYEVRGHSGDTQRNSAGLEGFDG